MRLKASLKKQKIVHSLKKGLIVILKCITAEKIYTLYLTIMEQQILCENK